MDATTVTNAWTWDPYNYRLSEAEVVRRSERQVATRAPHGGEDRWRPVALPAIGQRRYLERPQMLYATEADARGALVDHLRGRVVRLREEADRLEALAAEVAAGDTTTKEA